MAQKTSINIKPCNIGSSEPHNRRTAEYLTRINKEKFYIRTDLMPKNEAWVAPDFRNTSLTERYNQIAVMVKEKTGRAMQTKDRERVNKKTGKVTIVRGSTPLKEGVVVIKEDTTMEQLKHFCEVCKERWGITPLQVFIHRDEGHYSNPEDIATWKPNLHAHIVWDWMDHETGKSCKLDEKAMCEMQTVLAECLEMQRGISKKLTGKEHLERNDFIIEKQRAELERIEAERQHKEHQIDLAEQELKQVKSEIRTDKLKSVATDAATALASGVSSLFGSGKMKSLERKNEDLRDEIVIRNETIEQLQSNIKQMQVEHSRAMMNKDNEHRKALEAKEAEHKEETNILNSIINTAHRWYPDFAHLLRLERLAKQIGLSAMEFAELIKGRIVNFTGRLFSSEHNRWFATDNTPLQILRDNDKRLTLTANRIPLSQWFNEQYDKLRQSIRQPIQQKKGRGMKM